MSIKTGLFFLTFCCIITPISRSKIPTVLWKVIKKLGENKNKLKTVYPKNHENFKKTNFTGCYKKECTVIFIIASAWCQSSYFSVMGSGNNCKYCNVIESQKTVFQRFQDYFPILSITLPLPYCITSGLL